MIEFKKWFLENMWGDTPCKTRKPSDGWTLNGSPATVGPQQGQGVQQPAASPKMMRKMKKK